MEGTAPVFSELIRDQREEILAAWSARLCTQGKDPALLAQIREVLDALTLDVELADVDLDADPVDILVELGMLRDCVFQLLRARIYDEVGLVFSIHRAIDGITRALVERSVQRLRIAGEPVARLAYDLRNQLSSITLAGGLLERKLKRRSADASTLRQAAIVLDAAKRMERSIALLAADRAVDDEDSE